MSIKEFKKNHYYRFCPLEASSWPCSSRFLQENITAPLGNRLAAVEAAHAWCNTRKKVANEQILWCLNTSGNSAIFHGVGWGAALAYSPKLLAHIEEVTEVDGFRRWQVVTANSQPAICRGFTSFDGGWPHGCGSVEAILRDAWDLKVLRKARRIAGAMKLYVVGFDSDRQTGEDLLVLNTSKTLRGVCLKIRPQDVQHYNEAALTQKELVVGVKYRVFHHSSMKGTAVRIFAGSIGASKLFVNLACEADYPLGPFQVSPWEYVAPYKPEEPVVEMSVEDVERLLKAHNMLKGCKLRIVEGNSNR